VLRIVLLFAVVYLFWRILRSAVHVVIKRPHTGGTTGPKPHKPDFSDVQDTDYEDVTPPRDAGTRSP